LLLVFATLLQANAKSYAQSLSLNKKNVSIVDIFKEIKRQTDYNVICDAQIIKQTPAVSIRVVNASIKEVLDEVLIENGLSFVFNKNTIVIKREEQPVKLGVNKQTQKVTATGTVTNKNNQPLIGVSIQEKGTTNGTVTDVNGVFNFTVTNSSSDLLFKYLVFLNKDMAVSSNHLTVVLVED